MASAKKNQNNPIVSIEGLGEGVRQQIAIGLIKVELCKANEDCGFDWKQWAEDRYS